MKSNIDFTDKSKKILMDIHTFNESLINTIKEIDFNLIKIKQLHENHNDFINFVKTTKLYENYKWTNLISDYKFIKKKINKDKKCIHKITKFLCSLTNYYTQTEIDNINITINDITCNTELMMYKFNILHIQHIENCKKKNNMLKKKTIITINENNDANKQLLIKIYENYRSIKKLNIKINNLKYEKKHLKYEINNMKTPNVI
jgi:hypothetical protein